jgi:hypothetical protein
MKPKPDPAEAREPDPNLEPAPEPAEPTPPPDYQMVAPPCAKLRSKGMYVYTDGPSESHGDYDNTIFWCLRTHKSFGPDDDLAQKDLCCDPSRSCYEAL